MTEVFCPRNSAELWSLQKNHPKTAVFCGGTDLLVRMRAGQSPPETLICLERLPEINRIKASPDEIAVGAAVTHTRILNDPLMQSRFPVLITALKHLGSPHIRNMGSIGGNIMTASPAGDCLPPLYILQAEIELKSETGTRRLPLADFITGPGRTRIEKTEILSRIFLPGQAAFSHHLFEKVGLRKSLSIAVVSIAALYNLSPDNTISDIRLAWGSIGPTIVRRPEIEKFLLGKTLSPELLKQAADRLREQIKPISDIRAGAAYRRQVAGNLLQRLQNPC